MWEYNHTNELYHFGIKGQKWGVRRYQNADGTLTPAGKRNAKKFRPQGIRAKMAKRKNDKIDKSFNDWKDNERKRDAAISLGKQSTVAKRASAEDPRNKELRLTAKKAESEYKKAMKSNTTYRKGVVKKEVLSDRSRKSLSDAKKIKKQLDLDPSNKNLQKTYNKLMSDHAVQRSQARRAPEVSAARSQKIASMKRTVTMTVKATVIATAVSIGAKQINSYLQGRGLGVSMSAPKLQKYVDAGKKIIEFKKFI